MTLATTSQRSVIWWIGAVRSCIHDLVAAINPSPLIDSYAVASVLDMHDERTAHVWLSSPMLMSSRPRGHRVGVGAG